MTRSSSASGKTLSTLPHATAQSSLLQRQLLVMLLDPLLLGARLQPQDLERVVHRLSWHFRRVDYRIAKIRNYRPAQYEREDTLREAFPARPGLARLEGGPGDAAFRAGTQGFGWVCEFQKRSCASAGACLGKLLLTPLLWTKNIVARWD